MGITLTRKTVGNIAKAFAEPKKLSYLQRIDMIAVALGFENQAALMATLKEDEKPAEPNVLIDYSGYSEITARAHSDDYLIDTEVDARPYLVKATAEAIEDLMICGWGGDYPADRIYEEALDARCQQAISLGIYLDLRPHGPTGDAIGYEVSIKEYEVKAWLKKHRPEVLAALPAFEGDDIEPDM
ncbi:MAG: hypothetical protein ABJN42_24765 [Roseibium sp.]|uniref:hypothetical protein n=1 Tax=Roseibium sp. TaxID=1936156 RepID=UPI00329A0CF6